MLKWKPIVSPLFVQNREKQSQSTSIVDTFKTNLPVETSSHPFQFGSRFLPQTPLCLLSHKTKSNCFRRKANSYEYLICVVFFADALFKNLLPKYVSFKMLLFTLFSCQCCCSAHMYCSCRCIVGVSTDLLVVGVRHVRILDEEFVFA